MKIMDAVIQGIIQGLTEFLPVSSSGHLLISQHILGVKENNLFFNVMLHIGTLLAVLAVYHKTIIKLALAFLGMIKDLFTGKLNFQKLNPDKHMVLMLILGLTPLLLLFLPVLGSSVNIKDIAEELSSEKNIIIAGLCLVITSFLLYIGVKKTRGTKIKHISFESSSSFENLKDKKAIKSMDALWIGVMQFIAAIFPGISRSGSTLSAGLLRGIDRQTALDYSFVLGVPAIIAAAGIELKECVKTGAVSSVGVVPVAVGMLVSAIVGFLSIKLFKWLLKTDKMNVFVIYTFLAGAAAIIIGIIENIRGFNIFTGFRI